MLAQRTDCDAVQTAVCAGKTAALEHLLRELIQLITTEHRSGDNAEQREEEHTIMLDVELDGTRYVMTRTQTRPASTQPSLSPREQEIARMVAEGYPNKTIAAVLDISSWTVSTHLRRIFAKLGVRTRAAMVAHLMEDHAMRERLTTKPPLSNKEERLVELMTQH